jgi:hypothetical protein
LASSSASIPHFGRLASIRSKRFGPNSQQEDLTMGWNMFGVGAIALLAVAASGCGSGSDDGPTPTAVNRLTPAANTTVGPGADGPPAGLTPGGGPPPGFTPDPNFTPPAGGFPRSFGGTPPAGGFGGRFNTPIAEFLDISKEELAEALQEDGATLASVAEDHGKSRDEVRTFLIDDAEDRVAAEVDAGTLTQEEADDQVAMLEGVIDRLLDGSGGPPIMGTPPAQ